MPRYFFHILSGGVTVEDEEGMQLPGMAAAQEEAVASARDLAFSADKDGFGKETRSVQIVDAAGAVLGSVPVPVLGNGQGGRQ
jgi:hypothetical protein